MANVEAVFLSTTSTGAVLDVAATSSPGTDVHVVPASQTDMPVLWAFNHGSTVAELLTLELGGTAAKDRMSMVLYPNAPPTKVLWNRLFVRGTAPIVKAYASTTNVIGIIGMVQRVGGTATAYAETWLKLSASTDGVPIDIDGNAGAPTDIHVATSTAGERDYVTIEAHNYDTDNARGIGIIMNGSVLKVTIQPLAGSVLVVPGCPFNGITITGYPETADDGTAAADSMVAVSGHVFRRSAS